MAQGTITDLAELCLSDPDQGISSVDHVISNYPQISSDEMVRLRWCKILAYDRKIMQVLQSYRISINRDLCDEDMPKCFDETMILLLQKALFEFKCCEQIQPSFYYDIPEEMRVQIDNLAAYLEIGMPGHLQSLLGKTKLKFFSGNRLQVLNYLTNDGFTDEELEYYSDIWIPAGTDVPLLSAIIHKKGKCQDDIEYISVMFIKLIWTDFAAKKSVTIEDVLVSTKIIKRDGTVLEEYA